MIAKQEQELSPSQKCELGNLFHSSRFYMQKKKGEGPEKKIEILGFTRNWGCQIKGLDPWVIPLLKDLNSRKGRWARYDLSILFSASTPIG